MKKYKEALEKAKKYKEVLEKAKEAYKNCASYEEEKLLESLFPEIAESEDEKIRKAIIEHLRQDIELEQILSKDKGDEWIAWLEKQGEQSNIENQPQGDYNNPNDMSFEDDCIRKDLIEFVKQYGDKFYGTIAKASAISWLEKQGGQKSEWSEDDEKIRKTTIAFLKEFADKGYENAVECIDWLKSLKPQSHWKPTEEQMQTLHAQTIEGAVSYPVDVRILISLYNDLLKL